MDRNLTHTSVFHEQYNQMFFVAMDTTSGQLFTMWETEKKWQSKGSPIGGDRTPRAFSLSIAFHAEFQQYYLTALDGESGQLYRMWFSEDIWNPVGESVFLSEVPELVRKNA